MPKTAKRPTSKPAQPPPPALSYGERIVDALKTQWGPELLTLDGFDDCIVGVVTRAGGLPIVCYDRAKVLAQLETTMSRDDAREYLSFNMEGYVGERTPCFLEIPDLATD